MHTVISLFVSVYNVCYIIGQAEEVFIKQMVDFMKDVVSTGTYIHIPYAYNIIDIVAQSGGYCT